MRGLLFDHSLPRLAATRLAGFVTPRAFVAASAPVRLARLPEPEPPGPGWVRCRTLLSGICGSDSKQIFLNGARDNPLTALISFPHVLGHEAVAVREDTGERVVLNPWLSCGPRGVEPACGSCREGNYPACLSFTGGCLPASIHLGNCASAPGTHADGFVAHESQLFAVPDALPSETAVLADPVSVSLHSLLKRPPRPGRPALVYGGGTLGLAAIALLRHLHPDVPVWAVSRPGPRAERARALGAQEVFVGGPDAVVEAVARLCGTRPHVPWSGRSWLQEGPGVVYDTVGSPESVDTALRVIETGGALVVSGVEAPRRFEWTPLYFKEVEMVGSNAFGIEELGGVSRHAFEHYFDLVAKGLDVASLVTHRFPLAEWGRALTTIARRGRTGAIKVLLEP